MITEEKMIDAGQLDGLDTMPHPFLHSDVLAEVLGFETDEVALRVSGSDVETHAGSHYIDFTGGIAVHATGHNHPEVVAAVVKQATEVMHTSDIMRHTPQLELGEFMRSLLGRILPGASPWTFLFKNSGSESIDAAAKLALKATGRSKFIALDGAFHGRTLFASTISHSKKLHWNAYEQFLAPLRENVKHAGAPHCEQCAIKHRVNCCQDTVTELLNQIGPDVAAVFIEAQQGEGGYFPMTPAAAQKIREETRKHGVLLIMDEIQAGYGRTGRWFGFEHLGIEPDIIVMGKAIGGGLPLAVVAARQDLMRKWESGEHGTTFGGNPVSCAAGLAAMKIIEREGLVERAAFLGDHIKGRLKPMVGTHGIVDVRGNGLMIAIELRDSAGNPDYARCEAVKKYAREEGLLFLTCGAKIGKPDVDNSAIRLIPALNIEQETLDRGLDLFIRALGAVEVK